MLTSTSTLNVPKVVHAAQTKTKPGLTDAQVEFLRELVIKGGPEVQDYDRLVDLVNGLDPEQYPAFREVIAPALTEHSLQGWTLHKPFGYAGDFMVIEKIYQQHVSPNFLYRNWDRFYHIQHAARAVRNRKEFFKQLCVQLESKNNSEKHVLILGSGPATDVFEYLESCPDSKIRFELIDWDQNAIDYATEKNRKHLNKITFHKMNVLRFRSHLLYDMIWSAGLFDYFKEKHFIYLLKKFEPLVADGGEMVVGNFSRKNPTRCLMEAMGEWYLIHRSEYELMKLCLEAGIMEERVMIDREPLGINLFLRIKGRG
ncbi:MAG TPA: class I SAM-dependent methyltransferase [Bacteroidetes bacterium]|nr:class I SAM-dependent methyltransferase [Bacteroidota bacterium]